MWAIGKLRGPQTAEASHDVLAEGIGADVTDVDLSVDTLEGPSFNSAPMEPPIIRTPAVAPAPPLNKDIADRLETMTQRLSEMQSVLSRQTATPSLAGGAAAPAGQGFSPETIDKLLKIIGNVLQQVDILQRSLNIAKPEAASPTTPQVAAPRPMVSPMTSPMGSLSAVKKAPAPAPAPAPGPSGSPPSGLPKP